MSELIEENKAVESDIDAKIKEKADALVAQQVADIQTKAEVIAKNRLAEMLSSGTAPVVTHNKGYHMKAAVKAYSPHNRDIQDLFGTEKSDESDGDQTKLYGVNFGKKHYGVDEEIRQEFLQLKQNVILCQLIAQKHAKDTGMPRSLQDTPFFQRYIAPTLKGYDLATFANFIPTIIPRQYFEEMHLPYSIKDYFKVSPMQSQLERREGLTGRPVARLQGDTDTFTAQSRAESSFTLTAKDFVYFSEPSQDIIDDATPDLMQAINMEHGLAQLRAIEQAIINGDDSVTHQDADSAAGAVTLAEKAFKGLRKKALANSAGGGTVDAGNIFNYAIFQQMFQQLSKGAFNGGDLLWILGDADGKLLRSRSIPEIAQVSVVNLSGGLSPAGLSQDGKLPDSIIGAPAYASDVAREDLNASGVNDGLVTSFTNILLVKLGRFVLGERMPVKMWMDRKPNTDILQIASKTRYAFNGVTQSSSEVSVVNAFNVAKS